MNALLLIGGVLLILLALYAVDVLIHRPAAAAWLVLGLVVIYATVDVALVSVSFGGFRVSLIDLGFGLVAYAAVLRLLRARSLSTGQWALIVFGLVILLNLVLGVTSGPVDAALNEFRLFMAFVGTGLYFSTVDLTLATREGIAKAWLGTGLAITGVVVVRWLARLVGFDLGVLDDTYDAAIRVLSGPETMFVASGAVILLLAGSEAGPNSRAYRRAGVVMLMVAVLLNRRTIWVALAAGLVVLLVRERRIGMRASVVAVSGLVVFAFLLPFFTASEGPGERAAQSATDLGTLGWRIEGWSALLNSNLNQPADFVVGKPLGTGFERTVAGRELESNPHSFYVQTLLRTGVVGLAALITLLVTSIQSLLRRSPEETGPLRRGHLFLLLVMLAIFLLTWLPGAEQALILGLAVAAAAEPRRVYGIRRRGLATR